MGKILVLLSIGYVMLSMWACTQTTSKQEKFSAAVLEKSTLKYGDSLRISVSAERKKIDSIAISIGAHKRLVYQSHTINLPTKTTPVGKKQAFVTVYSGGRAELHTLSFLLTSDISPLAASYSVLHTYAHDVKAYTQGLEFVGDTLIESTGLYGESSLRLTNFTTGAVLTRHDISHSYFGEGITMYNNKIYQLTWQSHVGFVYEYPSLKQVQTFTYSTEGWGLCNDGTHLIMSDGTENLYFLNPETFAVEQQIQVYEHSLPVVQLNELEYVDGYIYANIYTTNNIVKIDAATGRVVARYNFDNLLDEKYKQGASIDVFNGIAWHKTRNTFFVTGKLWPLVFEIKLHDNNI